MFHLYYKTNGCNERVEIFFFNFRDKTSQFITEKKTQSARLRPLPEEDKEGTAKLITIH